MTDRIKLASEQLIGIQLRLRDGAYYEAFNNVSKEQKLDHHELMVKLAFNLADLLIRYNEENPLKK